MEQNGKVTSNAEFQLLLKNFFLFLGWSGTESTITEATTGLQYQPRMMDDDECGAVGGMRIGRGNRSTRRISVPVALCPPQIPHDVTRWPPWWEAGD
jgi:hypothetical protein